MSSYDPKKAAAVWQRVQSQQEAIPEPVDLLTLIARAQEGAVAYLYLSRKVGNQSSALLRKMAQQEQSCVSCLKGIYAMMTGQRPQMHSAPAPRDSVPNLLRRCYGREKQSLAQYEARAKDREYGHIFTRLAAQTQEHCQILLSLLGRLTH